MTEPLIIQGGMGVAVSNWKLAAAVARTGQMGVVSGTALDAVLARRLQLGDPDGSLRRALRAFPDPSLARRVLERHFIPGGKAPEAPFRNPTLYSLSPPRELLELTVAANFVEVFLAKEGHDGPVGVNYLEKIQLPTLPALYGALLAGVEYVLMGAGIPRAIPAILDCLVQHQPTSIPVQVHGTASGEEYRTHFDPGMILSGAQPSLKRPKFLAIVSSEVLALALARKASGRVDGFVVEGPTAGGHNAPPRGPLKLTEKGEPLYGPRDAVDPEAMRELGLPFWLAGSYADPGRLKEALAQGAAGIQVGTFFAYCEESGLAEGVKQGVLGNLLKGGAEIFTDPKASPTGFPFKVVRLEESLSEPSEYQERPRICNLGYLRTVFKRKDGSIGYRCPGEPVDSYLQKEGNREETEGKKCVCNGLMAAIGLAQNQRSGYRERPLITSGDALSRLGGFLAGRTLPYHAADVVKWLLSGPSEEGAGPAAGSLGALGPSP